MLRLKDLRIERGISQDELANVLGCSQSTINNYEKGKHEPDIDMLISMARFFKVSVDYLIGNSEIRTPLDGDDIQMAHKINRMQEPEIVQLIKVVIDRVEKLKG